MLKEITNQNQNKMITDAEYQKALDVLNEYPKAIKVVMDYHTFQKAKVCDLINVDLTKALPVRACNVLYSYFKITLCYDIKYDDLYTFSIYDLINVDLELLKRVKNCGMKSHLEISELVDSYKLKLNKTI